MKVIGWEPLVPELAVFFSVLRRRQNDPTPLNLFLVGAAGTNKTVAASEIATGLFFRAQLLDAGTIDDVAELAGVVNLKANLEMGESSIIAGDLLGVDVLVLDEFLNVKPHVLFAVSVGFTGTACGLWQTAAHVNSLVYCYRKFKRTYAGGRGQFA